MSDFWTNFIALVKKDAAYVPAAVTVGETIVADVGLAANPVVMTAEAALNAIMSFATSAAGQEIGAAIGTLTTHTATPGAALVIEPKPAA